MSQKSGLADSPFFTVPQQQKPVIPPPQAVKAPTTKPSVKKIEKPVVGKPAITSNHDTVIPRNHDTTASRHHDTTIPEAYGVSVELVRKAVKEIGKEAATHRFTDTEKKEIADLIYTYKNQGIRTNENVVTRIAVNFIIEDYKENGENSVLHKILEALNE